MNIIQILMFNVVLFYIGLTGIMINRKNIILILISIEIILLAVTLNFIFLSYFLDDIMGEIFAMIILTIAAAESAIALAIIISFFKARNNINVNQFSTLSR